MKQYKVLVKVSGINYINAESVEEVEDALRNYMTISDLDLDDNLEFEIISDTDLDGKNK